MNEAFCPDCDGARSLIILHDMGCHGFDCKCSRRDWVCEACLVANAPRVMANKRPWIYYDGRGRWNRGQGLLTCD